MSAPRATGLEGGCRCGALRYRVDLDKLPRTYACHCLDCQTWSGSAFSQSFVVPENALHLTGTPTRYERTSSESGRTTYQRGCATCITRVYNTNSARPGLAVIRAGTLDCSDELSIIGHIWTKRKMAGIEIPKGVPSWPETAPLAELMALLAGP